MAEFISKRKEMKASMQMKPDMAKLISDLPIERGWNAVDLHYYHGTWLPTTTIPASLALEAHFRSRPDDVIITTTPKSGTTWLKALAFAIRHREKHLPNAPDHPLLRFNPHQLVRTFEVYDLADLEHLPSPRLLNTHFPFHMLSTTTKCKLVFLCRNPGDNFISHWKFHNRIHTMAAGSDVELGLSLEEAFDLFCSGRSSYGPYWDSVLGYWQASKQEPERVLFLHYEELKQDPSPRIKRLASFLGVPFTEEEEEKGVVDAIINLCSFDKMSNLEVNKTGKCPSGMPAQVFFRSGGVGDWSKYLTSEMVERLNSITHEKMKGSGLDLIL